MQNLDDYGVEKGTPNTVRFTPVKTTALKLEVEQPDKQVSGIFEWEIK